MFCFPFSTLYRKGRTIKNCLSDQMIYVGVIVFCVGWMKCILFVSLLDHCAKKGLVFTSHFSLNPLLCLSFFFVVFVVLYRIGYQNKLSNMS